MALSRLCFGMFYRFGSPPWDGHALPQRLQELVEGNGSLPPGKAIDLGCGTGDSAIYLARHGWDVTAVDFVKVALDRARAKAKAVGVAVRFLRVDVTRLSSAGVGTGVNLIIDSGLLHGLSDEARDAYVREVSSIAAPGATLLLSGFAEGKRRGPRGVDRPEIERRFAPGWELLRSWTDEEVSNMPDDPIHVHELVRKR